MNDLENKVVTNYVNLCIDTIIKHGLLDDVTDLKSFANIVLPMDSDDDSLIQGIGQGAAMAYSELADDDKAILKRISIRSYYMNKNVAVDSPKRELDIKEWSPYLLELVHNRIRQHLEHG